MTARVSTVLCIILSMHYHSSGQVINELLCSNRHTNADEDGDASDWVEIYNDKDHTIDIGGFWITDDVRMTQKWRLPPVTIKAGEQIMIWLSGKDKSLSGSIHGSFKLSTIDETFAIVSPFGSIVDIVHLPRQYEDQSFGRIPNGMGRFVYLLAPSPAAINVGPYSENPLIVDDVEFSSERGFYVEPFLLSVTTETDEAEIWYTLDGSTPGSGSGYLYTAPIYINDTTIVRAAAYKEGYKPTNVKTNSYVFINRVITQDRSSVIGRGFPEKWDGVEADYEMDKDVISPDAYEGRYASVIEDSLRAVPVLSIALGLEDLFGLRGIYSNPEGRGDRWEREASIELFNDQYGPGFQINAGLRINGNASRHHSFSKKHSFRLHFRNVYGSGTLEYKLFPSERSNSRIDTLVLRAHAQDGWQAKATQGRAAYSRDAFARESMIAMRKISSHHRYVHLYLNGVYWGMYEIVERPDHGFSAAYHGGDKSEWDAISDGEASHGSTIAWATLLAHCRAGLQSDAAYEAVQGRDIYGHDISDKYLNTESLVDYMINCLYIGNKFDWPNSNWWSGRRKSKSTGFHFYVWDSELSLGLRSDYQINLTDVETGVAVPFAAAKLNKRFQRLFGDRVHEHFFNGGVFYVDDGLRRWQEVLPEGNIPAARFSSICAEIEEAIVAESARWGDQHNIVAYTKDEHWAVERDFIRDQFLRLRSHEVLHQMREAGLYPTIDAPVFKQHGGLITAELSLRIKSVGDGVWYTLDGSDPCSVDGNVTPSSQYLSPSIATAIISDDAALTYHVPNSDTMGLSWTQPEFNDTKWHAGRSGVGFGKVHQEGARLHSDVENVMRGVNSSIYIRIPFSAGELSNASFLSLDIAFDGGYIAYINGVMVAERHAPDAATWNSKAIISDNQISSHVDVSKYGGALRRDVNVLAIHGLNDDVDDDSFFIAPLLFNYFTKDDVIIGKPCIVSARTQYQGEWSALNKAEFVLDRPRKLIISEVMYNPPAENRGLWRDSEDYEFLELHNNSDEPIQMSGYTLNGGVRFAFADSAIAVIAPRSYIVVVRQEDAFSSFYKTHEGAIAGEYKGGLGNDTDEIRLYDADDQEVDRIEYRDSWFASADGNGYSLIRDSADPFRSENFWRTSLSRGGSPGEAEPMSSTQSLQLPGDWNQDGKVNIIDVINGINMIVGEDQHILPCEGGSIHKGGNRILLDANEDNQVDVRDPLYLIRYVFQHEQLTGSLGPGCIHVTGCHGVCK